MGGDALLEGKETPQKVELLARPSFDLAEILGPGHRPAQDDQQDLGRRIDDLPGSARVLEGGKMIEKAGLGHRGPR
jgi:hypothetical protein